MAVTKHGYITDDCARNDREAIHFRDEFSSATAALIQLNKLGSGKADAVKRRYYMKILEEYTG